MKKNNKIINEYDMTKEMIRIVKENMNNGNRLNGVDGDMGSEEITTEPLSSDEIDDEAEISSQSDTDDMIELSREERNIEEKKFRETVSSTVKFTVFNIYPKDNNVVFGGKFTDLNGLEWQFNLKDTNGIYVSADNLQLTEMTLEILKKLTGFYSNWISEWGEKLATEYGNEN